jgi:hypothetical protein
VEATTVAMRVGRAPTVGSILQVMDGRHISDWTTLAVGQTHDFENTQQLDFVLYRARHVLRACGVEP